MDIIPLLVVAFLSYIAGRNSTPVKEVEVSALSEKERQECQYQSTLNQTLLSEVQQYRTMEKNLREEIWQLKQTLKTLQQNN
jgi:hypothetical protein